MIIGLISDTHNKIPAMVAAVELLHRRGAELLLHAGDWTKGETAEAFFHEVRGLNLEARGVLGNNDAADRDRILAVGRGAVAAEPVLRLTVDGVRIGLHHGHVPRLMKELVEDPELDLVVRGHSHRPVIIPSGHGQLMNPGSTAFAIPRRAGWQPTVVIYDTDSRNGEIITYAPI